MKRALVSLTLVAILFTTVGFGSTARADEAELLIKASHSLEQMPLGDDAKKTRGWAIEWLSATDKVSVTLCGLLISKLDKNYKYQSELFGQYTIGMGAFKLENPDLATDEDAVQEAGIESALKVYEVILAAQPKAKNAFMDGLLAKREDGALAAYLRDNNCKEK